MRILLAEDEHKLGRSLTQLLQNEGYSVDLVQDGEAALERALVESYDLIILDIGMPLKDGFEVLSVIKDEEIMVPVLLLTARDSIQDKVKGLDLGADDYLVKPFEVEELLARLRVLSRRTSQQQRSVMQCGDLTLDSTKLVVKYRNQLIDLSPREYSLLHYLMLHVNTVVLKQRLLEQVWGEEVDPFSKVVDVYIGYLRKKFRVYSADLEAQVVTVKGMGYKLVCHD